MEVTWQTVKALLREVLQEEAGSGRARIAPKYDGGTLVLRPADPALKSHEVPIDTFFKKVTSVRERLRVLEQKLNNNKALSMEDKAEMQQLITKAYGSLTTFNVLFAEEDDKFRGSGGES